MDEIKRFSVKGARQYLKSMGIDVAENTMNQWRSAKRGPKYCKLPGSNLVFYREPDLIDFVEGSTVVRTIDCP